jgi:hypothetical protein
LLNSGKVKLLDNQKSINQICNLERRTARSGKDSINHAPGSHDDSANSIAGACSLSTSTGNTVTSMPLDEFFKRLNADNYQVRDGVQTYVGPPSRFIPHPTRAYRQ